MQLLPYHRRDGEGLVACYTGKLNQPSIRAVADTLRGEYG